jgi:hypothetical protein
MLIDPAKFLAPIPPGLRDPLLRSYQEIGSNFIEHRWEPSELNGGKFCEIVYTIVLGALSGSFAARPSKPKSMYADCQALEKNFPPNPARAGDRSLRILIPRMLPPLYEIRNNRGVGHAGGDVDPNFLDASAVYGMTSWILAELVRIFHNVSTEKAQVSVDALIERKHPLIWEIEDIRRVLDPKMTKADQALLLMHQKPAWVAEADLIKWVDYDKSKLRTRVLLPLHKERLIEYDPSNERARISPLGAKQVEEEILKTRRK